MAKAKVSNRTVDALNPGDTVWDTELAGFGVRCQRRGRTYIFKTRVNGKQRTFTIGRHGAPWTPAEARKKAKELLGSIAGGEDLHAVREGKKRRLTMSELAERYLDEHAELQKKRSSVKTDRSNLKNHIIPFFGDMFVADVDVEVVNRFLRNLSTGKIAKSSTANPMGGAKVKGGKGVANRCRALLSKMFNLAEQWKLIPQYSNPTKHAIRFQEHPAERYLSDDEMERLGGALADAEANGTYSIHLINAIRTLILTGARLGEIQNLKWSYIDHARGVAFLPDSKTGKKILPLSGPALDIINATPRVADNEYVFCGSNPGAPIVNFRKPWGRLRASAGLDDVRLHDLRHNFASVAINSGTPLAVIGGLLGHKNPKTTQRYAHLADSVLHEAGNATASALAGKISPALKSAGTTDPALAGQAVQLGGSSVSATRRQRPCS